MLRAFVLSKPVLDGDILSLNPSKLAQLLPERLQEDRATGGSAIIQETYARDFPCLLRLGECTYGEQEKRDYPEESLIHGLYLPAQRLCHKTELMKITTCG